MQVTHEILEHCKTFKQHRSVKVKSYGLAVPPSTPILLLSLEVTAANILVYLVL